MSLRLHTKKVFNTNRSNNSDRPVCKIYPCAKLNHHAMKTYGEVEILLHTHSFNPDTGYKPMVGHKFCRTGGGGARNERQKKKILVVKRKICEKKKDFTIGGYFAFGRSTDKSVCGFAQSVRRILEHYLQTNAILLFCISFQFSLYNTLFTSFCTKGICDW
jgi:hypothetical protein